ncbi:MAG: DUF3822 family protein [Chlorobi bacterium]|nr:DUF3822 family protein [Chlorobiota bacterium]
MTEFAYLDESLDINQTQSYHLSIQLGLNGLSFCILDTITNKYIALRHFPLTGDTDKQEYPDRFGKIVETDDFLRKSFKSSAVMVETFKSTLVPAALFRKEEKDTYFTFSHALEEDEVILTDKLSGTDAYCLYATPSDLLRFVEKYFSDAVTLHHTTPFIEGLFRNATSKGKEAAVHVLIHDTCFDIAVTRKQKLSLVNTYLYRQVNDMVYFILYIFQMLQLDQQTVPIILEGKINAQSSLIETLKRYVKNVSLVRRNSAFTYSYKLNVLPAHTFANLFNIYPCV